MAFEVEKVSYELIESLRPLPPENVGRAVAATLSLAKAGEPRTGDPDPENGAELTDNDGPGRSGPTICPA